MLSAGALDSAVSSLELVCHEPFCGSHPVPTNIRQGDYLNVGSHGISL